MANSSSFLCLALFSSLVFFIATPSLAKTSFRPKALVLPVAKHSPTHQYLTSIKQRTPLVPVRLTLDLGGQFLWVDCQQDYVSSTYKPARCNSAQCSLANSKACTTECNSSPRPGCNNNTCSVLPDNSVIPTAGNGGEVGQDIVSLHSTDGSNPTTLVSVPNFLFACAETFLLDRLASGVKVTDSECTNLGQHFDECFNYIEEAKGSGSGRSRSTDSQRMDRAYGIGKNKDGNVYGSCIWNWEEQGWQLYLKYFFSKRLTPYASRLTPW